MGSDTKKRKKSLPPDGANTSKKVRFSLAKDAEKPEPRMKKVSAAAAAAAAAATETTPVKDASLGSLKAEISAWMEKQDEYDKLDLEALMEESEEVEEHEEAINYSALETPIRIALATYTEQEKCKSFKFECEWSKCKFMTGVDRKYFLHVEAHADCALDKQGGSYTCEWDLCDFHTTDRDELVGHVHYHAYHTKLKVHGASIHMLMKLPSCKNDSRVRNTIANRPVTFRCEWNSCNERFIKAMEFFHHVANHMRDQFEPGSKNSPFPIRCRWSLCKKSFTLAKHAVRHLQAHTTERVLGCYNCGAVFWARIKFVDHCVRQIDIAHRKYQCPECNRFYTTAAMLQSHVQNHTRPVPCTLCPLKFSRESTLAQHMIKRHFRERNFKCRQCEFATFTKHDLMSHMRKHDATKMFRCAEFGCNVAYRSEYAIKKHIAWHYNIPPSVYECHLCQGKRYSMQFKLSKHLSFVHELERPPGHCRYRYKLDSDGVFRLATHVESKQKPREAANVDATQNHTVVSSGKDDDSDNVDVVESAEKSETSSNSKRGKRTDQTGNANDAAEYAPVKGKPKIRSVKSIGVHEFAIELVIDPDPEAEQQTAPEVQPAATASKSKDVKDFTVMKRYLKPSKKHFKTDN